MKLTLTTEARTPAQELIAKIDSCTKTIKAIKAELARASTDADRTESEAELAKFSGFRAKFAAALEALEAAEELVAA